MTSSALPPLIPRVHLFGNPTRTAAQISPDGAHISFLAPRDGVLNVWVAPVDDLDAARAVTDDVGRGIRSYMWAANATHLLYIQDKGGDENWRIYSVDVARGTTTDLTPMDGVQARFIGGSWESPDEMLVALNDRDPQWHDALRLNVVTGERVLVEQNERFVGFVADEHLDLVVALEMTADGGLVLHRRTTEEGWEPFVHWARDDTLSSGPLFAHAARGVVYLQDSRDRDTAALVACDLKSGEITVIGHSERADVAGMLRHPTTREIEAWSVNHARIEWHVLDERVAADLEVLGAVASGDLDVVSRTKSDQHWVVLFTQDDAPATYYLYDRTTQTARKLFTTRPELEGAPLSRMHSLVLTARDGLELVCYLTLPSWTDPRGTGIPDEPLPLVLAVHGGPWARDSFGYDPLHQMLANRGYAVLAVNFRGSTGFGKHFVNAGDFEWGRKMHDDLLDAVEHTVSAGIADPDRIGILGGSYGGYATLVGLTVTPEVFACGVDIVGPSNLETLLATIPAYWRPMFELFAQRVGDPRTEEGRALLRERSPLHAVDAIVRPLLIGQGANDPRVKQAESDQIVGAMQEKGLLVTYVLYPDEGHGFARPENNLSFWAVTESFLARCLGGRCEPIGTALEGASIEVPVGAEHFTELAELLAQE